MGLTESLFDEVRRLENNIIRKRQVSDEEILLKKQKAEDEISA